jgi:hypothetical protein
MAQIVEIDYDCGAHYEIPTTMPETGSMLHHASLIDTLAGLADAQHASDHPECATQPGTPAPDPDAGREERTTATR